MNISNLLTIDNLLTVVGLTQATLALFKRKENMAVQVVFGVLLMAFSFKVKLYADIFESLFITIISIIGLKFWYGKKETPIHKTNKNEYKTTGIIMIISFFILYAILTFTDDPYPFTDAITTAIGLGANWLMARKSLQAWSLWFVYDIITCVLYFDLNAYGPTFLSFVWTFMAVVTYISWDKEIKMLSKTESVVSL